MMPPRRAAVLVALAVPALLAIGIVSVGKQVRSGNDFPIYWQAARTLAAGGSPYDIESGLHGYVYPPFLAILLLPLTVVPLAFAASLWFAGNVAASALAARTALRLVRRGWGHEGLSGRALAVWIPLVGFFADNAALGQVNVILLALTLTGCASLLRGGRDLRAGLWIGLAACVKPHLALLAAPALVRGRWRVAAGLTAAVLLAWALIPLLALGPSRTALLWKEWHAKVIVPARDGTLQGSKVWDQSPQAGLRRLVVDAPAFPGVSVNIVSVDPGTYTRLSRLLSLLLLALLLSIWVLGPDKGADRTLLMDQGLAFTGTLLLVGYSLKAHFVALLLPFGIAAALARQGRWGVPVLVLASLLVVASNPGLAGRTLSNWCLAFSAVTVATLLVAGYLGARRIRP